MLYLCGYVDSLTLGHWLATKIAGNKLRVLSLLDVPWHEPIIKKETLDFHRRRPVATVGWKNYIISPANPALVVQIACCEHGMMRTDLLLTWSVFNCGLFWAGP